MFDKLEDIVLRLEEVLNQLQEPDVANDQNRFRKLMKEQAELTPIRERRKAWEQCLPDVYDILAEGSKRAKETAAKTLADVRHSMKIDYFDNGTLTK